MTTIQELMLARADDLLSRLGLPKIGDDDKRRHQLLKAISLAMGGPADVLVDALLRNVNPQGKAAGAMLRGKAMRAADDLAHDFARVKSAIAAGDAEQKPSQGAFYYLTLDDGTTVPVTNATRQFLGLKAVHDTGNRTSSVGRIYRDMEGKTLLDTTPARLTAS